MSDTGCGIPKSFRGALFEPFRQADTSLTRPRQGTGLGLSIVKHLVQRMSGRVNVDSVEGEGSTFTVELPSSAPSSSANQSPAPALPPPSTSTPNKIERKRIRVVHRHQRTETLFVDLWNRYGHSAFPGDPHMSVDDLLIDTDVIWADLESVALSPTLYSLMHSKLNESVVRTIPLFIVYSEHLDLVSLEPELSMAQNVVLLKRPIIMHNIVDMMNDPYAHMGSHIVPGSPKVRFAIPPDQEKNREQSVTSLKEKYRETDMPLNLTGPTPPSQPTPEPVKEKVLLVEDNLVRYSLSTLGCISDSIVKINQRLGCRLLEKLGYEVITANDGEKAVTAIKQTAFCCCIMDCQMPGTYRSHSSVKMYAHLID